MSPFLDANPLAILALLLGLSVTVPLLFRRLRLPDPVGLLLAGVVIGPHGLGWLSSDGEIVHLLSSVGVVYLLFIAGLEIDLGEFRRIRERSMRFGLLTFSLPMAGGAILGLLSGYPLVSAVLIGSILASHTPLGYPIVRSYGFIREEAVTVAVGGTIFTDISALVVLALCIALGQEDISGSVGPAVAEILLMLVRVALYAVLVVVLIKRLGRALLQHTLDDDGRLFVSVLVALFLAAVGAELAGVEKIVGGFLAGLAVNAILPEGRVKEQVIVVGASLFIPIFFIDLGLLLDLPVFLNTTFSSLFTLVLILGLIGCKGIASWITGRLYGYSGEQVLTLWSLSMPQVAATLAAGFVGYQAGLIDERVLNSILALMVVTATLGPMLTTVAMTRMGARAAVGLTLEDSGQLALARRALRVLVPIARAEEEAHLLTLAGRLTSGDGGGRGEVLPLVVVSTHQLAQIGGPQHALHPALAEGRRLLQLAEGILGPAEAPGRSLLRVDSDVPDGIARAALEQGADLVVVGVEPSAGLGRWLFGDPVDAICRQVHCPVVMAKLRRDPSELHKVLVPVKDPTAGALEQFQLAERFIASGDGEGSITLLHLHDPLLPVGEQQVLRRQLERWIPKAGSGPAAVPVELELVGGYAVSAEILRRSRRYDLVILRSQRRMVEGLPIPASDRASELLRRLRCSSLVVSDPLHAPPG